MKRSLILKISICSIVIAACCVLSVLSARIRWVVLSIGIIAAICIPFYISFEKKSTNAKSLVLLSVLTALSILSRLVFFFVPHFKPVSAICALTGIFLGPQYGFLCGAMTALISNFYFGQGLFTPFQMIAWGLVGLLGGLLSKPLKSNYILSILYSVFSGLMFSLIMDIWTAIGTENGFSYARYIAAITTSLPITAIYMISNAIFTSLLFKPMKSKIQRIQIKYGLTEENSAAKSKYTNSRRYG